MASGRNKGGLKDNESTQQFDLFAPVQLKETKPSTASPPLPKLPLSKVGVKKEDPIREQDIERLLSYQENELVAARSALLAQKDLAPEVPAAPAIYSVTEVSKLIRDSLREFIPDIIVRGEIADFKGVHRNGHLYFALKDDKSQIRAVMWKPAIARVPFDIKGGLEVIATCKPDFYAGSGSLQLVVEKLEPVGMGALQLKLEQLKEKLKQEGLFDQARKKLVKSLNWRIGIVTSKTGAALFDMLRVYNSRFPLVQIYVVHAAVQGDKAPDEIVRALERIERWQKNSNEPLDVVVVTRGGGSYEDLFCFNDERIIRAMARMSIPTVSAIGHEIDVTLADFVADKRSATPSHAASETVPEYQTWIDRLRELEKKFQIQIRDLLRDRSQKLDTFLNRLVAAAPEKRIQDQKKLLLEKSKSLESQMRAILERQRGWVNQWASVFEALSPLRVMDRGYSIVKRNVPGGSIVRSISEVSIGEQVEIQLSKGFLVAEIKDKKLATQTETKNID
jgi:exodeoxyribonuclease VII large subunit